MAKERPDRLHLWAQAASEWLGTQDRVTREGVHASTGYGRLVLHLATNVGLADFEEDNTKGIPFDTEHARELAQAERAIVARLHAELQFRDTLQFWTRRETARRVTGRDKTGNAGLARALIEAQPKPGRFKSDREAQAEYKAMLRKVEEWKQAKYTRPTGINAVRVALLRGALRADGRTVNAQAAAMVDAAGVRALIGVRGDWAISETFQPFTRKNAREDAPPSRVHEVLADAGRYLIATVVEYLAEAGVGGQAPPELEQCYALYVEMSLQGD